MHGASRMRLLTAQADKANAELNPFRYRGYYYDSETGYYYLQTRYYNPEWGRFINADGYINANGDILGYNMFAYCSNNPVMGYDPTGEWNWGTFFDGGGLIMIGAVAMMTAATILTCGTAPLLMVAVASATMVAGAATTISGVAEVVEAGTDYNFVRDGALDGDAQEYDRLKNIALAGTQIGTVVCATYYENVGNVCFKAGTAVSTEDGNVAIESIKVGDLVWATDPETGETAFKTVVQLFRNETDEWIHVKVNGDEIICTPEHPFYSPVKGWTSAIDLRAGDILVMLNGEYVVVEQVQHELLESPETTYNFEVEDYHTYYVGDEPVLVHNRCGDEPWKTVTESPSAVNTTKGLSPNQYQQYENTLTKLAKGDHSGLNIHVSKGGYYSADIAGFGKGRGMGRVLYQVREGFIDVVEVTLKHFKK